MRCFYGSAGMFVICNDGLLEQERPTFNCCSALGNISFHTHSIFALKTTKKVFFPPLLHACIHSFIYFEVKKEIVY